MVIGNGIRRGEIRTKWELGICDSLMKSCRKISESSSLSLWSVIFGKRSSSQIELQDPQDNRGDEIDRNQTDVTWGETKQFAHSKEVTGLANLSQENKHCNPVPLLYLPHLMCTKGGGSARLNPQYAANKDWDTRLERLLATWSLTLWTSKKKKWRTQMEVHFIHKPISLQNPHFPTKKFIFSSFASDQKVP